MKKLLASLLLMVSITACEEKITPEPPQPEQTLFNISVQEDKLAAYSVTFDIRPEDGSTPYYYDIISKGRLETVDVAALKSEIMEGVEKMSEMTGTPVDEVLAATLCVGDKLDILSNAGYRPETEFCIYAFYWEGENSDKLTTFEFTTPAVVASNESVEVVATSVDAHAMVVDVTPTEGVSEYWYYFAERDKAEAMLADLEDENAYLSYHAMNVGTHYTGAQKFEHRGLKSDTEYMAIVMAIDKALNRFMVKELFATTDLETQQRVESELFTSLLGEWQGSQQVWDLYADPFVTEFTVNIVDSVADIEFDYRAQNQLVALVDGWCGIAYYSATSLFEQGIEEPRYKFGPKWLLNIAEGDVVTIDGEAEAPTVGWLFFGDCFTLNMAADGTAVYTDRDLQVTLSDDGNTMVISSPTEMENVYPGMGYEFTGIGWMGYYYGCSDITLTRK